MVQGGLAIVTDHKCGPSLVIFWWVEDDGICCDQLLYTSSFSKCLTPLTFLNMFNHSSYSKTFVKYVKLYIYIKVYLTINQMIEKKLIIT